MTSVDSENCSSNGAESVSTFVSFKLSHAGGLNPRHITGTASSSGEATDDNASGVPAVAGM